MIKHVSILGTGNVASQLGSKLLQAELIIDCVWSRSVEKASKLASELVTRSVPSISQVEGDLVLVCVSDNAISSVISQIPEDKRVVYTSGSVDLNQFTHRQNVGVLYPLQTISADREIDLKSVPILIEANNQHFSDLLMVFAKKLSYNVSYCDSATRKKYHLSAVWLNNFINHIAFQAKQLAEKEGLNWDYFSPLIDETMHKLLNADPFDSQTGPARRNDQSVLNDHESLLEGIQKEIYALISKSIQQTYNPHA
jgi:predicted short-subunit dehydrogenase-like oxidoreductase (DUF2520 family)